MRTSAFQVRYAQRGALYSLDFEVTRTFHNGQWSLIDEDGCKIGTLSARLRHPAITIFPRLSVHRDAHCRHIVRRVRIECVRHGGRICSDRRAGRSGDLYCQAHRPGGVRSHAAVLMADNLARSSGWRFPPRASRLCQRLLLGLAPIAGGIDAEIHGEHVDGCDGARCFRPATCGQGNDRPVKNYPDRLSCSSSGGP